MSLRLSTTLPFVCGFECLGDLLGERESLIHGNWPAGNPLGKGFPFDKLHDQERLALSFLEAVKRGDPRMIERCKKLSLSLETHQLLSILRKLFGKNFDGDFPPELGVPGAVDLSHPTRTEGGEDLISTQLSVGSQWHGRPFECEGIRAHAAKSRGSYG